jgi:hypothetical protein
MSTVILSRHTHGRRRRLTSGRTTATTTATPATAATAPTTLICLAGPEHLYGALRSDAALELIISWHPVSICCALLPSGSIAACFTLEVADPDDERRHALVLPAGKVP